MGPGGGLGGRQIVFTEGQTPLLKTLEEGKMFGFGWPIQLGTSNNIEEDGVGRTFFQSMTPARNINVEGPEQAACSGS